MTDPNDHRPITAHRPGAPVTSPNTPDPNPAANLAYDLGGAYLALLPAEATMDMGLYGKQLLGARGALALLPPIAAWLRELAERRRALIPTLASPDAQAAADIAAMTLDQVALDIERNVRVLTASVAEVEGRDRG